MADYEDTKVKDLIINNMSQEKFEELKTAGELDPTQLYCTPEEGGATLPDQTGNAGKFLTTDGTTTSWGDLWFSKGLGTVTESLAGFALTPFSNNFHKLQSSIILGGSRVGQTTTAKYVTALGLNAAANDCSVSVGYYSLCPTQNAIQINASGAVTKNTDANTFKVANVNGNFEIMSADGTMPTDRYTTTPTDAGTYVPKLTIAEDGTATREWGAESGGAGGDYLPLSGGTLTGGVTFDPSDKTDGYKPILTVAEQAVLKAHWYNNALNYLQADAKIYFNGGLVTHNDIGDAGERVQTLYVKKLYNNEYLNVPTKGGTLARLEDLEGIAFTDWSVSIGKDIQNTDGVAVGRETVANESVSIGYAAESEYKGIAIGDSTKAGSYGIALGGEANAGDTEFVVNLGSGNIKVLDHSGLFPRERLSGLIEVLPTAENGYVSVKNYGNGYVEITGYASIGTVGAGTGSEVQIDLPAGYTMADTNYWVNIAPTSETTMFDFKAEAKARSTTHFMVAYKNEDTVTGLTAAGVYWEVRGMLATTEA